MPTRRITDPFAQKIGARIRDLRLEQGKSLDAMEAESGLSKGHLSNIERGCVLMNVATLGRIAGALEMRVADLFAGIEPDRYS